MAGPVPRTDIHLVRDLGAALEIAQELEARAVGLDVEGVLGNYVGNEPYTGNFVDFMHGQGAVNMSLAHDAIADQPEVTFGLVTNNTDRPRADDANGASGLVTQVANSLGVIQLHKGMRVEGAVLRGKPSGELAEYFCRLAGVSPEDAVLIDDQGVKNTGEAVKAGMKAIIVPDPIGLPRGRHGEVEEHPWVRRARKLEPKIYESLEKRGWLSKIAYRSIAGVDLSLIGELHDHRDE